MREDIKRTFRRNLDYFRNLTTDIPDELKASQPAPGINHAVWITGHLISSFQALGGEMAIDSWLPEWWFARFGTGSVPDAEQADDLPKRVLLAVFDDAARRITNRLAAMSDTDPDAPLPDVRYRDVFPTLGTAALHILAVHMAIHLGQLSTWRRMVDLPRVVDPL
ncbi:MAG: DinB family protein [Planctomycetaceae bacterium]